MSLTALSRSGAAAPASGAPAAPVDETLTVIIPTKKRPLALRHTLAALLAQHRAIDQLIIVDQSAVCEREQLQALRCAAMPRPAWLYLHEPGLSGGAAARNRALQHATGAIWLFLDDDVELEPAFTAELLAAYRRWPGAAGFAGLITNYPPPPWLERGWAAVFRRGVFHDDRQPLYWRARRLKDAEPLAVSRFSGSAMSFRAAAVGARRFDSRLTGVSPGEDVGLCLALTGGGPGLFIAPRARLRHLRDPAGRRREHWVQQLARDAWFLFLSQQQGAARPVWLQRCWLAWLETGLALAALASAVRHRSLAPLAALRAGRREAQDAADRAPAAA